MAEVQKAHLNFCAHFNRLPLFLQSCLHRIELNDENAFIFLEDGYFDEKFFDHLVMMIEKLANDQERRFENDHDSAIKYIANMKEAYGKTIITPGLKSSILALRAFAVQYAKKNNLY